MSAEEVGEVRYGFLSFGEIWGKGREMWLLLREQQFRRNRSNTGRVCIGTCERDRKTKQLIGKEKGWEG